MINENNSLNFKTNKNEMIIINSDHFGYLIHTNNYFEPFSHYKNYVYDCDSLRQVFFLMSLDLVAYFQVILPACGRVS